MAYIYDEDLEFLQFMKSEDLNDLVYLLTYDPKDGKERITQELKKHPDYKKYYPNHIKYWKAIAEELQLYGGNTIANKIRGHGVLYREIVEDLLKKFKIKYNRDDSIIELEQTLLEGILKQSLDKMSQMQKEEFFKDIQKALNIQNIKETFQPSTKNILRLSKMIFKKGGFQSYQLTVIVVNSISKAVFGRGLSIAGNAALTKSVSVLTGPVGMVLQGVWELYKISGPAYRITLPAAAEVALLRQEYLTRQKKSEKQMKLISAFIIFFILFLIVIVMINH